MKKRKTLKKTKTVNTKKRKSKFLSLFFNLLHSSSHRRQQLRQARPGLRVQHAQDEDGRDEAVVDDRLRERGFFFFRKRSRLRRRRRKENDGAGEFVPLSFFRARFASAGRFCSFGAKMSSSPCCTSEERENKKRKQRKPRRETEREAARSMVMPSNVDDDNAFSFFLSSTSCSHLAVLDDLVDGLGDCGLDVSDGDGHRFGFRV